jgi:hypothetical protein
MRVEHPAPSVLGTAHHDEQGDGAVTSSTRSGIVYLSAVSKQPDSTYQPNTTLGSEYAYERDRIYQQHIP